MNNFAVRFISIIRTKTNNLTIIISNEIFMVLIVYNFVGNVINRVVLVIR